MSKITIDNYEAYLLDLSEGTLPGEMQIELELFLIQHPELNIDLSELAMFTVDTEEITFSGKQHLKKTEQQLVPEEQFIAYIENQLPLNERTAIEKSCAANPALSKELALFTKTIAAPDTSIVFENKASLKRKPKVIWFNFSATQFAAAASVLFLIGLFVLWPKSDDHTLPNNTLAEKHSQQKTNPLINTGQGSVKVASSQPTTVLKKEIAANNPTSAKQPAAIGSPTNNTITETPVNNVTPAPNNINEKNNVALTNPVIQPDKEEKQTTLLALNSKTTVDVITESDDEDAPVDAPKKKGIWSLAKRTLKNLNNAGVKSVNGDEEESKDNTTYALTLGKIQITHKAN